MEEFDVIEDQLSCRNCQHPMVEGDKYCSSCGQKNTTGKISVRQLLGDFISDNFHLNAQLPRTLFVLFLKPGKLTIEYFKGRHKQYFKPVRIFAVSAILFFAVMTYLMSEQMGNIDFYNNRHDDIVQLELEDSLHQRVLDSLESVKLKTYSQRINTLLDSAFQPFTTDLDSVLNDTTEFQVINIGTADTKIRITKRDLYTLSDKEIVKKYHPDNFWDRLLMRQSLRILKDSKGFGLYSMKYVSWMFFVMIPFFALILKLIYIRRKFYYVEHLVFTFHIHAFFFLAMILMLALDGNVPKQIENILEVTFIIGVLVYIFVSMRRVFRQGFFKTLIKFFLLLVFYFIVFMIFLIAAVLISAAFY
jgi:hypothetical protein